MLLDLWAKLGNPSPGCAQLVSERVSSDLIRESVLDYIVTLELLGSSYISPLAIMESSCHHPGLWLEL